MAEHETSGISGEFPILLQVETSSATQKALKQFVFDDAGYTQYLLELGISARAAQHVTVAFLPYSKVLEAGIFSGGVRKVLGGTYERQEEKSRISIFIGDILFAAEKNDVALNFQLNETLAHETGHLYEDVVLGRNLYSRPRRLFRNMIRSGRSLYALAYAMTQYETVQELLPLYAGYPETSLGVAVGGLVGGLGLMVTGKNLENRRYRHCPREEFAEDFGREFRFPEFIYAETH